MADSESEKPVKTGWVKTWGRRNLAYLLFVIILIPIANLLEAGGPGGPDAGGGIMLGLIVWGLVSLVFFVVNAIMLITALVKGASAMKPFIACLLPVFAIVGTLLAEELWLG